MAVDQRLLETLSLMPLKDCESFACNISRTDLGLDPVNPVLAFDVSQHQAANTAPAISVLTRFKDDVLAYAENANTEGVMKVTKLLDKDIFRYFAGDESAGEVLKEASDIVKSLRLMLEVLQDADTKMVQDTIPLLHKAANWVSLDPSAKEGADVHRIAKTRFLMNRQAGQNVWVWVEFLFGTLISSKGCDDLRRLNPYLSLETVNTMFSLITTTMLRANRLGHVNRCIGAIIGLEALLQQVLSVPVARRTSLSSSLVPKLIQAGEDLSKNITMARHYMKRTDGGQFLYDPRYLVFEFVWNIQLRKKQVEIVNDFRECLSQGKSKVKQMIMGAGKTSVVAPLLALIVADGSSLVLSVVPKALIEMSRTRMRETFCAIMTKRIYTLEFDRSTKVKASMRRSLENAATNRGVVVATPTTLKSIMLSYIESLQQLREPDLLTAQRQELVEQSQELCKILQLFKEGIMLLDEVDLILHPLKRSQTPPSLT